jgi:hypothetical protein
MALGNRIVGDMYVDGNLAAKSMTLPAAAVGNAQVKADDPIARDKLVHEFRRGYAAESATTAAAGAHAVHVAAGAGTVLAFRAGCVVANIGNAWVKFDLKKNGATVLTALVETNSGNAAYAIVAGTIDGAKDEYVDGDVFEVVITVNAGTGTLGKGAFAEVVFEEAAV